MGNPRDAKLLWLHSEKTFVVGVDIGKHKHWARALDLIGLEVGKAFSFENTPSGFFRLLAAINEIKEKTGASRAVVSMEPSGHYWKVLASWLQSKGIPVVLVNPMHVKVQKETNDNSPTKNDRKDAFTIADLAREGKFLKCILPTGVYAELRGLTQLRQEQLQTKNAVVNRIHALLDEFFPEFETVFPDPFAKTPLLLLTHSPFPCDLLGRSLDELTAQLKAAADFRMRTKPLRLLLEAASQSIGVREGLEAARLRLRFYLEELRLLQEHLDQIEDAMARAVTATEYGRFLLSVPGVGIVAVAGFLGEIGDPAAYQDWRQLRKMAGLDLAENSSGQHRGRKRISKRGRPYLRCLLYQVSLTLIVHNPEFKALYHHFRTRQNNPLEFKQALIAVACKLLRVFFHLATEQRLYDPSKVLGPVREMQLTTAA